MMYFKNRHSLALLTIGWCASFGGCAGVKGGGASGTAGRNGDGVGGSGAAGGPGGAGPVITTPGAPGISVIDNPTLCHAGTIAVGRAPLRRLSRVEYNNMVRDLGLDPTGLRPADQFVSEQKIPGNFNTNAYAAISGTLMNQQYLQAAETLAASAVSGANLAALVSCASQANAACAQQFIGDFGQRAFRGQLDDTESSALLQLHGDVSAKFDFSAGIQAVITAILTSPRFLFVLEFGDPGASGPAVALSPMEIATRLALYLWRSLPDQPLVEAATSGQLASADGVAAQATRMLGDPRATDALQDFANQWLDVENMDAVTKDTQFTNWTPLLAHELHTETLTTFSASLTADDTDYPSLLTSTSSYVNPDLAAFYSAGVPGTLGATSYVKTPVGTSASPRMGLLTQGSVLAMHAHTSLPSPTLRGRLIRQQLLCDQIGDPPALVGGQPIPPPPATLPAGHTTRQQYMQHFSGNALCASCHQYMDYLGFGLDNYDATGAFITTEGGSTPTNGTPVDSSGMFVATGATGLAGSFTGATDMITQLAASTQARACFALQEMRYAFGRVESPDDACSAAQVYRTFQMGAFNAKGLLVAIASSDSFRYRKPVNAGSACQ
jgi:Protein of unknown function (DUF1592)/Protein of unknown function (DUF1588)/Protein of unknown function (DUF1595)/Protein of unknown function (DUF1587)/Protein of unknown function (DUF1585)